VLDGVVVRLVEVEAEHNVDALVCLSREFIDLLAGDEDSGDVVVLATLSSMGTGDASIVVVIVR